MRFGSLKSLAFVGVALVALSGSAIAAELAKPQTASERYYARRNIAQDSDSGALPPGENALTPLPDTADALVDPVRKLQAVPVKSSDGKRVGRVEKVELANGRARVLKISVEGKTISLSATRVLYDPRAKVAHLSIPKSAVIAMADGEGVTASIDPKIY